MNTRASEMAMSSQTVVPPHMYTLPDSKAYGTQEVMITPELATAWLRRNEANRKLRHRAVQQYAHDMVRGAWKTTGESIKFSDTGRLLDGQHRLAAIVDAGIGLSMVVVTGLDNSAFDAIDTGRSRTGADVLLIEGVGARESAVVAGAMPLILNYQRGLTPNSKARFPNQELIAAWNSQSAIRRSSHFVTRLPRKVMPIRHSKALFLHWVFCQRDIEAADSFIEQLFTGELLGRTEPLYHLRQRLLSLRMEGQSIADVAMLHACIKAWNATRQGRNYNSWRPIFPRSDESFPEVAR